MYRRYVKTAESKKQLYEYFIVSSLWLLVVNVFIFLTLKINILKVIYQYLLVAHLIGIFLNFLSILLFFYFFTRQEKVIKYHIDGMTSESKRVAHKIKKIFTDDILINRLKMGGNSKFGKAIPLVYVRVNSKCTAGYIAIENIGVFETLDKIKLHESLSGILKIYNGKFLVVSSNLSDGNNYQIFNFEDSTSHRLIVKNNEIKQFLSSNLHEIKVQDDLSLTFGKTVHHLAIIARTRAGKTKFSEYLATIMKLQGWIVEYNSAKKDIIVHNFNGMSDPEGIVKNSEKWVSVMNKRISYITLCKKENYTELNLPDIAVFFDELGNLGASLDENKKLRLRWETAIKKLTATGASAGIHVIAISQQADKVGIAMPTIARSNLSDSVIMLGAAANSGDERRFMMAGYDNLPKYNFDVGQGFARFVGIGGKWSAPHFFETPFIVQ